MRQLLRLTLVLVAFVAAGCVPGAAGTPGPSPTIVPSPSPGAVLGIAELRYRLIDELGRPEYCDPDSYPVGRDEVPAMRERFPEIERDPDPMAAIRNRLAVDPDAQLTDDQRLAIYREWKLLNAIVLDGPERAFNLVVRMDPSTGSGTRVTGTIAADGTIRIASQEPGALVECPICLAIGTTIATPDGDVRVEDVRLDMAVWSLDGAGRRIVATVLRIGRTPVPASHAVVRLELADGRVVRASPGHPLADGRLLGSLRAGDIVDGSAVHLARLEPYRSGFTYDLLTSGADSAYLAGGILLASTLEREP